MCKATIATVIVFILKLMKNNLLSLCFVKDCDCLTWTLKSCSQHSTTDLRSHWGWMWSIFYQRLLISKIEITLISGILFWGGFATVKKSDRNKCILLTCVDFQDYSGVLCIFTDEVYNWVSPKICHFHSEWLGDPVMRARQIEGNMSYISPIK